MILHKIKKNLPLPAAATSKDSHLVALDIGTEYVKALIARVEGEKLEIIGVGRAHQGLADMQSGAISDIAAVVDNCDKALNQAETMAGVEAQNAVVGIAGELVKGVTATLRYRRSDPSKSIGLDEMEHIIERVQERAGENAKAQMILESASDDIEVRLVNSALVSIEIDGYSVSNPVGFQGTDVAIQLYTAHAPMIHIGAIERVTKELDLDLIAVAAEPFAVARSVIGADASSALNAILIDVGGGTTDIAVVNEGGVEGTKMFGIGGRAFTRIIANELGVAHEKAEALKLSLASQKGDVSQKKDALQATKKTLRVWRSGVELALSEFDSLDHLPHHILLCGGGSSLESIAHSLSLKTWAKELPFAKQPVVQHITPSQVVGITDKTGTIHDHTYITAMGLLRVGLDTIGDDTAEGQSIKDRLNKLLSV